MIKFSQKGDFSKVTGYFQKQSRRDKYKILNRYGQMGVEALKEATPKDTGLTSESWSYDVSVHGDRASIIWNNKNIIDGVPIAIILQYGHATGNGGWVEGLDYINPALQTVFDQMALELWKEMTEV